ncbi:serine aminopeptidase domain-containing protein [Undibacterium umbellatum]|uniref:Alpha/beta hydrolase n=1 Tax=Undibacterium umbellatum TaxID=2762300 RepID=A0ABR6ZCU5_9BURK|nr:alpha/beta hydrolase [Undibacterium umbellatum]MBC3909449.1 alpha/beta hydrolase [Undibacterium umbellatum]
MATQQYPSKDILFTPQAFWFGDAAAPMLGWYHPARVRDAGGSRQCGVVLCPPFGHEYMVSYLSYKHLAIHLAKAGFDVCFFDYNNSGDAVDVDGGDRVALWQENIRQAARQLRQMAGVEHIALFGLRLGALLAGTVAAEIDAKALMLMAPVISGRAYAREMLVLRSMSSLKAEVDPDQTIDPNHVTTDDELTGYEFTAATRSSLGKLDLSKLPAPAMPVFLQQRDDITGQDDKLVQAWHHHDHALHLSALPGYSAMMREDAHDTVVPAAIWQAMSGWLGRYFPLHETGSRVLPVNRHSASIHLGNAVVVEELVEFEGMNGIVSHPSSADARALPCVILCNIGANHRVGNHRLYVTLARNLASQGFYVLRFDKSGIGYSRATPDEKENDVHADSGVDDLSSAMYFMQGKYHSPSFVMTGLCSGAYMAYLSALRDERVTGLVLINQLTYRWREGDTIEARKKATIKSTHFYVQALAKGDTWKRVIKGQVDFRQIGGNLLRRVGKRLRTHWQLLSTYLMHNNLFLGHVVRNFQDLEARGTELVLIYEASDTAVDVMTEQFGRHAKLLGKSERICLKFFNGADHTFTPRWSQLALVDFIGKQLLHRFSHRLPDQTTASIAPVRVRLEEEPVSADAAK